MEECDTSKTKVSDSAYSTSCNSRSQRSSGSSKSRHSGSSNSSGYCGQPSTLGSVAEFTEPSTSKRSKEKKKKSNRSSSVAPVAVSGELDATESIPSIAPSIKDDAPADPIQSNAVNSKNIALGLGPELFFGGNGENVHDDALQLAIINLTLSFVRKFRNNSHEPTLELVDLPASKEHYDTRLESSGEKPAREEEFTVIISMNDGMVKFTSTGLTDVLGFPCDSWTGRCIADFVQPKHRNAFANHVTSGVTSSPTNHHKDNRKTPFFCNIRSCRKNGSTDLGVQYQPCQLNVAFRQHCNGFTTCEPSPYIDHRSDMPSIYMVITITSINSAYTYPEETRCSPKFATRLFASSHLSEVDPCSIPYLGFLPNEMLGTSVLDFYHPEDMPFLKDVYETVIKQQGRPFLSKPYRFRTQNGGYVLLETEWSSYSNPWSHRLEFIIALNRVLKGPQNPDVFVATLESHLPQISEEVLKESKLIQEEILCMLNESVTRISDNSKKRILSKRCKVLASYVGSMLEDLKKADLQLDIPDEQCLSERDSVMLGEISPHHDYFDSKSSSETPPSYNQLNYNDNIQRFFESKPKTTNSDVSGKDKDGGGTGKNSPVQDSSLGSGDSGGGSGPMSGSAEQNSGSATSSSYHSYQQLHLTEALLTRHNEQMEKQMVQHHKEQRSKHSDKRDKSQSVIRGKKFRNHMQPCCPFSGAQHQQQAHGVKRIGSHSWENNSFKGSKHIHVESDQPSTSAPPTLPLPLQPPPQPSLAPPGGSLLAPASTHNPTPGLGGVGFGLPTINNTVNPLFQNPNLWQPFSMAVCPLTSSQFAVAHSAFPMANSTPGQPLYYMGNQDQNTSLRQPSLAGGAAGFNPNMPFLYHPLATPQLMGPSPLLYSPLPILQRAPTAVTTSLYPTPTAVPFTSSHPQQLQQPQQQRQREVQTLQQQTQQQIGMLQPCRQQQTTCLQQQELFANKVNCFRVQCSFHRPPSQATSVKAEPGSARNSVASASRQAMSVSSNKIKYEGSLGAALSPNESKAQHKHDASFDQDDESSFNSSQYSYLCTTSDGSLKSFNENRPSQGPPPWMEGVDMTPELILRYELEKKNLSEVLSADFSSLSKTNQPKMVDDQLSQLYSELVLEGRSATLANDEGILSSASSSEEWSASLTPLKTKRLRSNTDFSRLLMIFEDNAPIPSPRSATALS